VIGGLVLLVAGVLMIISVIHYGNKSGATGKYVERLAAGVSFILIFVFNVKAIGLALDR
jgi:hypothetical protein